MLLLVLPLILVHLFPLVLEFKMTLHSEDKAKLTTAFIMEVFIRDAVKMQSQNLGFWLEKKPF